jgi:hypothetical protein
VSNEGVTKPSIFDCVRRPLTLSVERYERLQRQWATASISFDSQTLSDSVGGVAPGNAREY